MKPGTPRHPKMFDLARRIGRSRREAVGIMEMLWHFTAEFAPRGDVGKYPDAEIEAACDWNGRKGALIEGLLGAVWLDEHKEYRFVIHDWAVHAPEYVRKRLNRGQMTFVSNQEDTAKVTGQCPRRNDDHGGPSLPLPSSPFPIASCADAVAEPASQPKEPVERREPSIAELARAKRMPGNGHSPTSKIPIDQDLQILQALEKLPIRLRCGLPDQRTRNNLFSAAGQDVAWLLDWIPRVKERSARAESWGWLVQVCKDDRGRHAKPA